MLIAKKGSGKMKKIFSFILLTSLIFSLAACSSNNPETGSTAQDGKASESALSENAEAEKADTLNNTVGDGTFTIIEEFDHTVFKFDYPDIKSMFETGAVLDIYFLLPGETTEGYQHDMDDEKYHSAEEHIYLSPSGQLPITYQAKTGRQYHDTQYLIEENSVSIIIDDLQLDAFDYPYVGVHFQSEDDSPFWEAFAPEDVVIKYDGRRDFIEFEDLMFARYLSERIGIPENEITVKDLEGIKEIGTYERDMAELQAVGIISADGKGNFTTLADLKHMPNIEKIYLSNHQITDISGLEELQYLRIIDLSSNNISDIKALSGAQALESVTMNYNNISDISPLGDIIGLKYIYMDGNNITEIPDFPKLSNLYTLSLANNQITDVSPLKQLPIIDWVVLDYNNITDVSPMVGMETIRELSLMGNPISDISPLGSIPSLWILNVKETNVTDFSNIGSTIAILERD